MRHFIDIFSADVAFYQVVPATFLNDLKNL